MAPTLPFTALHPIEVFAVEDRSAQLVWRNLPDGELDATVDGEVVPLGEAGRPGAAELMGLTAAETHTVSVTLDGRPMGRPRVSTTPALDSPELTRIATISDLHLGETGFGLFKEMREPDVVDPSYPLRCARAAVAEATAWGAELLVIKGDITNAGRPEQWEQFDELLDGITIPVIAIPGNHDTFGRSGSIDAVRALHDRGLFDGPVHTADLGGVRVVAADTTTPGHTWGQIAPIREDLCAAVDGTDPALVFVHHHLETHPYPRIWPLGTPQRQAAGVLDALVESNQDLLISSGHTHRNRARTHGPALITEVGSTKDHPGVWAGYVVHPNGVRQVVRRVARPDCIAWTDRTHAAVGGIWGRWSPGRISERSFVHPWPSVADREAGDQASSARV